MLKRAGLAIACGVFTAVIAHNWLLDGLDGWLLATFHQDDTEYAPGYTERAFRQVRQGMSESEVLRLLGTPLGETWVYQAASRDKEIYLFIGAGRLTQVSGEEVRGTLKVGMSTEDLLKRLGSPKEKNLAYTRDARGGSYRERLVRIRGNTVVRTIHMYYWD